ncbi:MAG TPA: class I SAM-dependent methyltransferase [Victivallales bacterium]|nr:class I SAM-dependent methyltransferase [Victivallales bacterium]
MIEDIKKYTNANREAWNQVMPKHQAAAKTNLDKKFSKKGFTYQKAEELLEVFKRIDVKNKDIIHLCCNNGSELLSLKNMGAARCIGIDISDEAVREANNRARMCDIDCQFVRSDIYDIPENLYNSFDIVHITSGGIGWIPDLNLFYQIVNNLLRKEGVILFHEIHPFSETIPFDNAQTNNPLQIIEPYFRDEPIKENCSLDYIGCTEYEAKTQYWTVHTISNLIMGIINNGMVVEYFYEYERDISCGHQRQEKMKAGIPLSYILIGRKK